MRKPWYTIVRPPEPKTIEDFARFRKLHLIITQHTYSYWTVRFEDIDIKDGPVLRGVYGKGPNIWTATVDYLQQIRGQLLVYDAMSPAKRREFVAWQEMVITPELAVLSA